MIIRLLQLDYLDEAIDHSRSNHILRQRFYSKSA